MYTSLPFKLFGYSLIKLRFFNILLLLLSAFILSKGLNNILIKQNLSVQISYVLFPSVVIFQLPSLWIERVPGYNNLSSYAAIIFIGCISMYYKNENKYRSLPVFFGAIMAFSIIVRPPSGLSLIFIFLLLCYTFDFFNRKVFVLFTIGFISFFLFHFLFIENIFEYYKTTVNGLQFHNFLSRQPEFIILRYINEIWGNLIFCLLANKFVLISFIILYYLSYKLKIETISTAIIFVFFIYICYKHITFNDLHGAHGLYWSFWRLLTSQFIFFLILLILHIIIIPSSIYKYPHKSVFLFPLILIISPLLLSVGTSNMIMFIMNFYTCLFFIGIIFTLLNFQKYFHIPIGNNNIILILMLFSLCSAYVHYDGRINSPLYTICEVSHGFKYHHSEIIDTGRDTIKVNKQTKDIFQKIHKSLNDTNLKCSYLINFTAMPGINFFFNLPHPVQPWTIHMKDNFTLQNIDLKLFSKSALLINHKNNNTLGHINKSFPNWKNSHYLKDIIHYNVNNIDKCLALYLPI